MNKKSMQVPLETIKLFIEHIKQTVSAAPDAIHNFDTEVDVNERSRKIIKMKLCKTKLNGRWQSNNRIIEVWNPKFCLGASQNKGNGFHIDKTITCEWMLTKILTARDLDIKKGQKTEYDFVTFGFMELPEPAVLGELQEQLIVKGFDAQITPEEEDGKYIIVVKIKKIKNEE